MDCCFGFYFRCVTCCLWWVFVPVSHGLLFGILFQVGRGLICRWVTGCCSGSPVVVTNLHSPRFFFLFFIFCLIFLVKGFVGLFVLELYLFLIYINGFVVAADLMFPVFYFILFYFLRYAKHCKTFSKAFSRMQPNTKEKLFSLKSFTFKNILHEKIFYSKKQNTEP